MEHFFTLLDDHTVTGELGLVKGHVNGRHLLVIDGHAALLDQTAGLAVGGAQAAGHQQLDGTDLTIGKPGLRQLGSGHIFAAAAAAEEGTGSLLGLVGLGLAVDQLGQLVGQDLGMRLSELVGINLSDMDRNFTKLRVIGKGSKERVIYLNDASRQAVASYLQARGVREIKEKNALFISNRGTRVSKQTVQHIVYKYLAKAGLEYRHLSTHKLRHTAATLMYQEGHVDVRVLKEILGHEQLNTTQIYTHVNNEQVREAMDANPLAEIRRKK